MRKGKEVRTPRDEMRRWNEGVSRKIRQVTFEYLKKLVQDEKRKRAKR